MSQPRVELPVIRIKNAWLLQEHASKHLHELWGKGKVLADNDWMNWKVGEYSKAWQPYEQKILQGMTDTLELSFCQNIIDVYIAPWFHAFSDPLVIGVNKTPDLFIDLLTHELLHRLLTDNTSVPHDTSLRDEWSELFGYHHSSVALVHIPVHAVHKAIYLDILNEPKRLRRDVAANKKQNAIDYVKAWQYVEENGYKEIIEQLRVLYGNLRQKK